MATVGVIAEETVAERASAALDRVGSGSSVHGVEKLPSGRSSLTFRAEAEGGISGPVVVKVAPPGLDPVRNRDVLRQSRLLKALADAPGVAVPEVLAEDEGDPPETPPLFVMRHVEGEDLEPYYQGEPPSRQVPAELARVRELAAARMLAALHAVDPTAVGLGDEPAVTLPEEIDRWENAFATVPEELRPGADAVAAGLRESIPAPMEPVILHGDFRLGNMLCSGEEIGAVIDWEIWSLGDPRVDLAWMLLMADPERPEVRGGEGMPALDEIVAAYEEAAGRKLADLDWFAALIRYKQASVTSLLVKNARKREQEGPEIDRMARIIEPLLRQAGARLGL